MKTIIHRCLECGVPLPEGIHEFSSRVFGYGLCIRHQVLIKETTAAPEAVDLYLALKSHHIPVELEYFDGDRHVDIALPGKLYIEVNSAGLYTTKQSMSSLKRSVRSLKENISTIHVPDQLLHDPETFHLAVGELTKACLSLMEKSAVYQLAHSMTAAQLQ